MDAFIHTLDAFITVPFNYKDGILTIDKFKIKISDQYVLSANEDDYDTQHLIRVYSKKGISRNDFEGLGKFLNQFVQQPNKYCTVSGKLLEHNSSYFNHGDDEECVVRGETLVIDDNIVSELSQMDPIVFNFLMKTACNAVNSPRWGYILKPRPHEYYVDSEKVFTPRKFTFDEDKSGFDIGRLKKDVGNVLLQRTSKLLAENPKTDREVIKIVGYTVYKFMRYVIKTNKTDLSGKPFQLDNDGFIIKDLGYNILSIRYSRDIEKQFSAEPKYLFHGSGLDNWFSILRNGVKNCSKTKMMLNGAASGSGVYTASTIETPLGYTRGNGAIAILQYLGDIKKGINVIRDDDKLLLRYILIKDGVRSDTYNPTKLNPEQLINNYFGNTLPKKQTENKIMSTKKGTSRLLKEFKKAYKHKILKKIVKIELEKKDLYHWKVQMFFPESNIEKQLKKIDMECIYLEIIFPDLYPMKPPQIQIIKPRIIPNEGYITSGGTFCIKNLSTNSWAPGSKENQIHHLLLNIWSLIIDDNPYFVNGKHSFKEGEQSFTKLQKSLGWK